MSEWLNNIKDLKETLCALSVRDVNGQKLNLDEAFRRLRNNTLQIREKRKTVYLIGNGASASMASHISADLAKNAGIHTEVFSDLSLITAIANDLDYEEVFAEPIRRRMVSGDMLIAISSSGQSPNILRAVREAIRLGGLVNTISAMNEDNALRALGTLNFYVPAATYGMAETCHAAILHYWIDQMVEITSWQDHEQFTPQERRLKITAQRGQRLTA
jgi:D-sedoheptulose 7-phosphate isomerase